MTIRTAVDRTARRWFYLPALLLVSDSLLAGYEYECFDFPDPPRRVWGVRYQAGDTRSFVPLGGLGTGTVYFTSRGEFAGQALANTYRPVAGLMKKCGFQVKLGEGKGGVDKPLPELAKTYLGHFPVVDIECDAGELPVHLSMRASGLFVPGEAKASATPGALFRFRAVNNGAAPVPLMVTFRWQPPASDPADGKQAQGNVAGLLRYALGDLAAGESTTVRVTLVAAESRSQLNEKLRHPSGDLAVDDTGGFNWEDKRHQYLTTPAGGCLSQQGFYVHYRLDGDHRAGTRIRGTQRLDRLQRIERQGREVRLRTVDGAMEITVAPGEGVIAYRITAAGGKPLKQVSLSVYANLEAGHTENDDRGWLDAKTGGVVIADDSGAVCALVGDRQPQGGWCGPWARTIDRMATGEYVPFAQWPDPDKPFFGLRRTRTWGHANAKGVTRESLADHSGCSLAALGPGQGKAEVVDGGDSETIAVRATTMVSPQSAGELRFVLTWYYPDARDTNGVFVGHQYANWYADSSAVARQLIDRWPALLRQTGRWQETIYQDAALPVWLRDQLVNSLYSLARNTAWLKDGRFTHSESFIGCPITETIVCRFYGSIATAMLFPELERNTMRQFVRHQRSDGAIPFAFGGRERWDSPYYETQKILDSTEFVLMAWRDYAWWRDRDWAKEMFPAVKRALAYARTLDTDGDGLINDELSRQYYDCWQFHGASSYTSGIYLAALKAGTAFGMLLDDREFAARCLEAFTRAGARFEELLYTGTYYRLWNDPARHHRSDTCLAAQLTGAWYASLCGLGAILPTEHLLSAARHIRRVNGAGRVWALVNGVTPEGKRDTTGSNGHSNTATLGETWCYAAMCVYLGKPDWGLPLAERLARNIALRQRDLWGTTWNLDPDSGRMLWGKEYYSNMCVWDLYGALRKRRAPPPVTEDPT